MQDGTESRAARQAQRRRRANLSAVCAILYETAAAVLLLWVRGRYAPAGSVWRVLLLILAVVDLGMTIPVLAVRRQRIKEISGGEEDEARKY